MYSIINYDEFIITGGLIINKFEYLKKFNSVVYGYTAIDKEGESLLNNSGNYFGNVNHFTPKWEKRFKEILYITFIVDDSEIKYKNHKKREFCEAIDKSKECQRFAKFIYDMHKIDIERTFFGDGIPNYDLQYREMLCEIGESIIAASIFENENCYGSIDKCYIDYYIYILLKTRYKKDVFVNDTYKKFMFEVRDRCIVNYYDIHNIINTDWNNLRETLDVCLAMDDADNISSFHSVLYTRSKEELYAEIEENFKYIQAQYNNNAISCTETLEESIEFIKSTIQYFKWLEISDYTVQEYNNLLKELYIKISEDKLQEHNECFYDTISLLIDCIFILYRYLNMDSINIIAESEFPSITEYFEAVYQKVYRNKEFKNPKLDIGKYHYFSNLNKKIFGTKNISICNNNGEPDNTRNDFIKCKFTPDSGERFKKIFKMGIENKNTKIKYVTGYTKKYQNFPDSDKIKNNFNKFISSKYGVDIVKTCGEGNCDEHMVYIMNNIIVPALFNNTYDQKTNEFYDNNFFVKIPKYLESNGMECKFASEAAEIRYKYKDLFTSLGREYNDNIIADAEKRANDLFEQLDTAQEANLIDSIHCLYKTTNEIENILNNKENTELVRKSIKVLTDKDYLRLLKPSINTDIENMFKELYTLKSDLIKSDEELYSDYMFLLLFIEKIK